MNLNRRTFLKTAALVAGGSLLPATARADNGGAASGEPPRRFIFIRFSSGQRPKELVLPTFSEQDKTKDANKEALEVDLANHELQPWMQALVPYKKNLTILQGMSAMMNTNGHGGKQSVMGCFRCDGRISMIKRATIDFELAKLYPSPFGHVELSLVGTDNGNFREGIQSGFAAPAPFQTNYAYCDPETAVNELFKSITTPSVTARENNRLMFLRDQVQSQVGGLVGFEQLKLTNIIESSNAIKMRNDLVAQHAEHIKRYIPVLSKVHADGGGKANTLEKMAAMTDVVIGGLASGLTNVVLYTIDNLATPIIGLPGNETDKIGIHPVGHGQGYSGVTAEEIREKIRIVHLKQIATMVEKLKQIPEGKGTMFDNTTIMYFPENGETHHSTGIESPWIILAGDNCRLKNMAGHYIRLPFHATEGHKTLGNWYTTLLNAHGNPIKHYGDLDLDMSRLKLDQMGPIKRFLA